MIKTSKEMNIDKLNTIDELNAIIGKLSKIMQYRKKVYADEVKQGQVKNYLKDIQSQVETLRKELIGSFDYGKAITTLFQIKDIKRILQALEDDKTAQLFVSVENLSGEEPCTLDPASGLKERILDVLRDEVEKLNVELENL